MSTPQSAESIRVLIVDDQQLLRQSFRRLLELDNSGIEVADAASDGQEALDVLARLEQQGRLPQVVLMDVRMPRLNGVEATAKITERWPEVRVLILTTFDDDEYILEGFRAGAKGYLLKDISAEELVGAIRAVHRGEAPMQPSVAAKLVARLRHGNEVPSPLVSASESPQPHAFGIPGANELTDREREILGFLARGASNREIGESLFITEDTVKNHVSNILSKLNLRDRTQAALWAREHGLG
jgi:DNA-binding NarL/FixJ family response regulator